MSELLNTQRSPSDFRKGLLSTVSGLVLVVCAGASTAATASDEAAAPTVWIELGGQLERANAAQEIFAPSFTTITPSPGPYSPVSPLDAQKAPKYSYGGEGKITIQPEDTNWIFSAGIRYGRSNGRKHIHQQTTVEKTHLTNFTKYLTHTQHIFADSKTQTGESHAVVDFQAGKDVGLGVLGRHGTSNISLGVRYAQFNSQSQAELIARPHTGFYEQSLVFPGRIIYLARTRRTDYMASSDNRSSFQGIGPSISWDASAPVAGNSESAEISFDWGINAAILFGRQKARGEHHDVARFYPGIPVSTYPLYGVQALYDRTVPHSRSRSVVVPNVGGLAGVSFRYAAAKVSFGYRADFFFGAMDGGIDTRRTVDRNFYGPFATVSIGLP